MAISTIDNNGVNLGQLGNRNLIINGAMQVAQRGTSATGVNSNGFYACDRMNFYKTNSATYAVSQSTDAPAGFSYSHKVVSTTGDSSLGAADLVSPLFYSIEGQDLQHLGYGTTDGKYSTLSFWVKTNVTGTYSVSFYKTHLSARVCCPLYTITTANTWQYVSLTVPSDTVSIVNGTGGGLYLYFNTTVGSTYNSQPTTVWTAYNSNNWAGGHTANCFASSNDSWQITGVQLEVGDTATPFEHKNVGQEILACKRYYQGSGRLIQTGDGVCAYLQASSLLPVEMRATPTAVIKDNAGNTGKVSADSSNNINGFVSGLQATMIAAGANNSVIGTNVFMSVHFTLDAEL